jgi:hypothetical protein
MNPLPTRTIRWRPKTVLNLLVGLLFSLSALAQPAFIKEGLVAYYPFNGNANDESGNGNNATGFGMVSSGDRFGHNKSSLSIDGISSHIRTPLTHNSVSDYSISIWIRTKNGGTIMSGRDGKTLNGSPGLSLFTGTALNTVPENYGKLFWRFDGGDIEYGVIGDFGSSPVGIHDGQWHFITATLANAKIIDGDPQNKLRLYVDGIPIVTKATIGKIFQLPLQSSQNVLIGKHPLYGFEFKGDIDDVRIYNRALSDAEVKALYDYESTPPDNSFITNGLVAYYPFNGNANDQSGNGYNGIPHRVRYSSDRFGNNASSVLLQERNLPNSVTVTNVLFKQGQIDFAFSSWVSLTDLNEASQIGTILNTRPHTGIGMGFGAPGFPGEMRFALGTGKSWDSVNQYPGIGGWKQDAWKQVVISKSGFSVKIYSDGAIVGDYMVSSSFTENMGALFGSAAPSNQFDGETGYNFFGKLDDIRIYNRALSDGEVRALYDYESTPPANSLNPRVASANAQVVNGFVVGATITDAGYGYESNPVVTITGGGGTGAKATATQSNGVVTSITITNPGSGYTSTPTITIAPPPFPPRKATSTAQIVNGFVVGTKITDGGFGYDSPPAVLLVGGGGSSATAVANVANGVVTAITITNPGTGYTSAPVVRIASPPFAPKLGIETSKVFVRMSVVLGRKYQLEASTDLNTWTSTGPAFIAQDEELAQEFDVNQVGRYFRINQVP